MVNKKQPEVIIRLTSTNKLDSNLFTLLIDGEKVLEKKKDNNNNNARMS
jgi:hypothetical protein